MITSITRICRRASRSPLSWIGLSALLLAGGYQSYNRQMNELPTVAIPAPVVPKQNAFDYFVRAGQMSHEADVKSDTERETMIAANEPALAVLQQGLAYPYQIYASPAAKAPGFYHYAAFRSLARLLLSEQKARLIRGDFAGATRSGLDGMQFAVRFEHGGSLIDGFVGTVCEQMARRYMWVESEHLTADEAASAARRLEAIDADRPTFADSLLADEWQGTQSLLSMLRLESVGKIVSELQPRVDVTQPGAMEPLALDSAGDNRQLLTLSKRNVVADYVAAMDAGRVAAILPYNAPQPHADVASDPISRNFIPYNVRGLRFVYTANQMHDRLLTATLALRAFRMRTGAYPESLDALVAAKILTHVPVDPFAPTNGVPLRYHKLEGDKFLLYSVGPDGADNDGAPIAVGSTRPSYEQHPQATDTGDWVVGANTPMALVDPSAKRFQQW